MKKFYSPPAGLAGRLAGFVVSVGALLFFMFYLAPLLDRAPFVKPMADFIEENEIDAGALYYTEIEEFSEAESFMRNTMKY